MPVEVIFPLLGLAVETGKITKWLKAEGDSVQKGEPLFELEAEKVTTEVESPAEGILKKILVPVEMEVSVFTVVGLITAPGEELPEGYTVSQPREVAAPAKPVSPATQERPSAAGKKETRAINAPPAVRRLAKEKGIDLRLVTGSGPDGAILMKDIQDYRSEISFPAEEEEVVPLSSIRKVIARRMTDSFQAPHFYLTIEVDTGELAKVRNQLIPIVEKQVGTRLTYTDLLIKIAAKALEDHPELNCAYGTDGVRKFRRIDIGLVAFVESGLIVPVVRQANQKSLADISQARSEIIQKAREKKLSREEMSGSTFTISNLGMYGIDQFSAVLNPPEAAILAIGRISDKPVAQNGQILIRPMMTLTLSIDHRVLDGVLGSQFLQAVKGYVENPGPMFGSGTP